MELRLSRIYTEIKSRISEMYHVIICLFHFSLFILSKLALLSLKRILLFFTEKQNIFFFAIAVLTTGGIHFSLFFARNSIRVIGSVKNVFPHRVSWHIETRRDSITSTHGETWSTSSNREPSRNAIMTYRCVIL